MSRRKGTFIKYVHTGEGGGLSRATLNKERDVYIISKRCRMAGLVPKRLDKVEAPLHECMLLKAVLIKISSVNKNVQ